jgi:hypothetical protein
MTEEANDAVQNFELKEEDRSFVAAALHYYAKRLKRAADEFPSCVGSELSKESRRAELLSSAINPAIRERGVILGLRFPRE